MVVTELRTVLLPVRSNMLDWQDKHVLSWPALAVLLITNLCVAQQVVLWPVSRVEPSCYGCGAVLEVVLSFILEG